jgi:hypothetical protein
MLRLRIFRPFVNIILFKELITSDSYLVLVMVEDIGVEPMTLSLQS